ncbi:hypothetical protein M8818_007676 [Zalaria obscura]|uniref:Uncharacterized protein n=1 Tax=Zalaria obscura TaxID=2024903 RepID=A0ACC3S2H1_9PEZI
MSLHNPRQSASAVSHPGLSYRLPGLKRQPPALGGWSHEGCVTRAKIGRHTAGSPVDRGPYRRCKPSQKTVERAKSYPHNHNLPDLSGGRDTDSVPIRPAGFRDELLYLTIYFVPCGANASGCDLPGATRLGCILVTAALAMRLGAAPNCKRLLGWAWPQSVVDVPWQTVDLVCVPSIRPESANDLCKATPSLLVPP